MHALSYAAISETDSVLAYLSYIPAWGFENRCSILNLGKVGREAIS